MGEMNSLSTTVMKGRCPDTFYCSDGTHGYSAIKPSLLLIPAYAALVSSSLSCLGAALIVCAYCTFKDLRKGTTQTIVTLLALADLGTAITGILGASIFISYDHLVQKKCYSFDVTCQIQGFLFLWSQFCGFIWTSILSIHLLLITVFNYSTWNNGLLPLYNIIAWMIPLTVTLPLLFLDQYGYNPNLRWTCLFIWNQQKGTGYLWLIFESLSTALIFIASTVIVMYVSCKQTHRSRNSTAWRVNKRILVILVAYIILRIPDYTQTIISTITRKQACSDAHTQTLEFITGIFEAVTDTSQGWVNCILYIFLSPEMRRRMFVLPFRRALNRFRRHDVTQRLRTSEITPLLGNTPNTLSTQGRARERGETYISYPTEFTDNPDRGRQEAVEN